MWHVQKTANATGILEHYCCQKVEALRQRFFFSESVRVRVIKDIKNCVRIATAKCLQTRRTSLALTEPRGVDYVKTERPRRPRAGFSWWEAWAQWRIWDFRKGLAIELQGFKN